ncbi:MAG: TonB-dependent receptor plug domain-containing protein, partial [Hyphomonadaceae bacterium]
MKFKIGSLATVALGALAAATPALAQETDEIVVTGSHIRGTPEDAALPVDVFRREELAAVGNPTMLELTRNMGASAGINSESNQYGSNYSEGLGNVNLRGLGPGRTLVLINGQRQAMAGFALVEFGSQQFVDTNAIPVAAIGRVEVLKDGAAATYGSDAVAGVVNFITRSDFEGFEIGGSAKLMDSDAFRDATMDTDAYITYGFQGDRASWVTTFSFVNREQMQFTNVDWALRNFADSANGNAGLWSGITNPGTWTAVTSPYTPGGQLGYPNLSDYPTDRPVTTGAGAFAIMDPGCGSYNGGPGGEYGPLPVGTVCRFNSVAFANMVEDEQRSSLFSEFNLDMGGGVDLHLEALWAATDTGYNTTPSYPPPIQPFQFVPYDSPAVQDLIDLLTTNGTTLPAGAASWDEVYQNGAVFNGRMFGPGTGQPGLNCCNDGGRDHETLRLAGGLTGSWDNLFGGTDWSLNLSWSRSESSGYTEDILTDRARLALLGLGGPDCDPETGTPGVGNCYWLNTFSSGHLQHVLDPNGTNPNYVAHPNTNTEVLSRWMMGQSGLTAANELAVAEAVFSGDTGINLAGGTIAWAAGAQVRHETYSLDPFPLNNLQLNPCNDLGSDACGTAAGAFQFTVGYNPIEDSRTVYAVFGELSVPITDTLDMQLAARFEQYPGDTGSTFDPKVQLRWQAADFLALRASAQTTFRAPTINQLSDVSAAQQPFVGTTFIPFDTFGNPDLQPESAFNYNIGAILDFDGIGGSNVSFNAMIDYWNFELTDPIVREGASLITGPALAAGCAPATAFYDRLTFAPGETTGCTNVVRIRTNLINGPAVTTDGIDVATELSFDEVFGGEFSVALDGSYINSYDVEAFTGPGYTTAATSPLGFLNKNTSYRPLPQWKANATFRYVNGPHSLALAGHYTTDYEDA